MGKNFSWVAWLKQEKAEAAEAEEKPVPKSRGTRRKVYKALLELGAVDPEASNESAAPANLRPQSGRFNHTSSRKLRAGGAA